MKESNVFADCGTTSSNSSTDIDPLLLTLSKPLPSPPMALIIPVPSPPMVNPL